MFLITDNCPVGIGRIFGQQAVSIYKRWEDNTDAGKKAKPPRLERRQFFSENEEFFSN
jgi:hypothetical protein